MSIDIGWVIAPLYWMWVVLIYSLFLTTATWVFWTLGKRWRQWKRGSK